MKTCSYCGKEYPDDATVCAVDGEPLSGLPEERKKVTGVWRGVFGYGPREKQPGFGPVAFTLKLKQGWLAHFDGSVTEDQPQGIPGTGTVSGYFSSPKVEFTKQMPVGYIIEDDGSRMTYREHFIAQGQPCEGDLPSAPIFYQGTLLDASRMQGVWTLDVLNQPRIGKLRLSLSRMSGFWCAQFITSDLTANPTDGPSGQLFDKSLLSEAEREDVEGISFESLGKFNVADAQALLDRFFQSDIRFQIKREDEAMQQALPIEEMLGTYAGTAALVEIFVHPEDEAKAGAIIGGDGKI